MLQRLGGPLSFVFLPATEQPGVAITATIATTTSGVLKAQEARPHPTTIGRADGIDLRPTQRITGAWDIAVRDWLQTALRVKQLHRR